MRRDILDSSIIAVHPATIGSRSAKANRDNKNRSNSFKSLIVITLMLVLLFIVSISFLTILICLKVFQMSDLEYMSAGFNKLVDGDEFVQPPYNEINNICTTKSCIKAGGSLNMFLTLYSSVYYVRMQHF
jgi:hypothetical protein